MDNFQFINQQIILNQGEDVVITPPVVTTGITDSNGTLLLDSNSTQILDSNSG